MLGVTYPHWSMLPMLFMVVVGYVIVLVTFLAASELVPRFRQFTAHDLRGPFTGHHHGRAGRA